MLKLLFLFLFFSGVQCTALDDYMKLPDKVFHWELLDHKYEFPGAKAYLLNVTTQQWLTAADSDRSIWWHQVVVIVPDKIKHKDQAWLWITGGENGDAPPKEVSEDLVLTYAVAMEAGIPAASIFQIPNQPVHFPSDPKHKRRIEDAVIAFTWKHFLENPNEPYWLLRLPMTKSCVKVMDAVQQFLQKHHGFEPKEWIVAGASKRGWTTWTVAAVDKRVKAAIPVVMDLLNIRKNLHHVWRDMGAWSFAFADYYAENLTAHLDDPNFGLMLDIIDPYAYRSRYTMPKLVIDATDDEFFMPEDDRYWWGQGMAGETHRCMVQNAEHSLATGVLEVLDVIVAFCSDIVNDYPRPKLSWTIDRKNGNITAKVDAGLSQLTRVRVRHADSLLHPPQRRDFRWIVASDKGKCNPPFISLGKKNKDKCLQPIIWEGFDLKETKPGEYTYKHPTPKEPWTAYFIEFYFKTPHSPFEYRLTTQETILPDTFPFPPCHGAGCRGTLV